MIVVYILLAILLTLVIFVLTSKIKIFFEYKKYPGEKLYTDIHLSVGFINLSKFLNKSISSPKKKQKKEPSKESKKGFLQKIEDYTKTLSTAKQIYSKNRWRIQKSLLVENAEVHIKFGLFDASQTGIAIPLVWTLLYTALAFLDTVGTVKKHFFEVSPVFTEPDFASQGKIKLSVRMINAILIALRLYLTYKKVTKEQ